MSIRFVVCSGGPSDGPFIQRVSADTSAMAAAIEKAAQAAVAAGESPGLQIAV